MGSHNPPFFGPSVLAGTRSLLQSMWNPQSTPFRGPASLLAHHLVSTLLWSSSSSLAHSPMSSSDTICNSPSPPLADIVPFGLPLKVFKMRLLGRVFHALIKGVLFSPTDMRSHIVVSAFRSCFMIGFSCILIVVYMLGDGCL